jgi:hypothetical protein
MIDRSVNVLQVDHKMPASFSLHQSSKTHHSQRPVIKKPALLCAFAF